MPPFEFKDTEPLFSPKQTTDCWDETLAVNSAGSSIIDSIVVWQLFPSVTEI